MLAVGSAARQPDLEYAGHHARVVGERLDMLARKVAQPKLHTAEDRQPFRTLWAKLF